MADLYLDIAALPSQNPSNEIPNGFRQITGSGISRVVNGSGYFNDNDVLSGWEAVNTSTPNGDVVSAEFEYILSTTMDGDVGVSLLSNSGAGYGTINEGFNQRIVKYSAGISSAYTSLGSIVSTRSTGDKYRLDYNISTGLLTLYKNDTSILTRTDTDYAANDFHAGFLSKGYYRAGVKNFTAYNVPIEPEKEITSIPDPIVFGEPLTIETTGFTDPTSITAAGMTAVIDSFEDGVITATWPSLDEGLVCTVPLPATNVELTVSESGGSASVNVDFPLTDEYPEFAELDNINTGGRYIGGKITLEEGWRSYYDNTQLGGMEILPDSGVTCTDAGTFTMLLHRIGDENDIVGYFITVNEHSDVVNVTRTIIMRPIDADGIVMRPLTMRGM